AGNSPRRSNGMMRLDLYYARPPRQTLYTAKETAMTTPLDTFEHVVVLMLENRSFDNILGYLYQNGVPPGKQFAGVVGDNLTNPDENGNPVPVSIGTDFHQPYPDPGEEFDHITAQLYGVPPGNA